MQQSSRVNAASSLEHQPEQQKTYSFPLIWTSGRTEQEGRVNFGWEEEEEEQVDFWDEEVNEQWWK